MPEKLKDYSEHHAMTFRFPDACMPTTGRTPRRFCPCSPTSLPMPTTGRIPRSGACNLILKSPQDWQTNVGLPFVKITGTTVEWDELRFDVRLLQRVPYEGVSRMQTSLRGAAS